MNPAKRMTTATGDWALRLCATVLCRNPESLPTNLGLKREKLLEERTGESMESRGGRGAQGDSLVSHSAALESLRRECHWDTSSSRLCVLSCMMKTSVKGGKQKLGSWETTREKARLTLDPKQSSATRPVIDTEGPCLNCISVRQQEMIVG